MKLKLLLYIKYIYLCKKTEKTIVIYKTILINAIKLYHIYYFITIKKSIYAGYIDNIKYYIIYFLHLIILNYGIRVWFFRYRK